MAAAQGDPDDPCASPNVRTDVRPNPNGPPTEVTVGVRIFDLREINDVDQTLTVDLGILRTWTDPRLGRLEGCEISLTDVWYPELVAMNSGRLFERWSPEVSVGPGGQIKYLQRFYGTLASYHSLHDFPFDTQSITLSFFPLKFSEDEVTIRADDTFTGIADRLNISDWSIVSTDVQVDDFQAEVFDRSHARYNLTITAERNRGFYIWKILIPLSLIVAMSWCVFWIPPDQYIAQIGLSATAMLTIIAFIFATTNMVPALGYYTLLDLFIVGSTVIVFLSLLESLQRAIWSSRERSGLALRIDRACRFAFPTLFVAMALTVFILLR